MASRVAFALALVGLCLAICNGVEGRILTGEEDPKVEMKQNSQYQINERPYIIPKASTAKSTVANVTNTSPQDGNNYIRHWALWEALFHNEYYGTKVSINAWALPDVKSTQISSSGVLLSNGEGDEFNVIQAGWHDAKSGDWWLRYHINDEVIEVGYWPKSIFTHLANSANAIQYGGIVGYPGDEAGPPMGSGSFPAAGYGRSAYIRLIQYVDQHNNLYDPDVLDVHLSTDDDKCYTAFPFDFTAVDGYHFSFGGAAGCRS